MIIFVTVLIVITSLISIICASQNFCGTRERNPQFVDDYSACRSYLFCNFNANNVLVSVHQLVCPDGSYFNASLSVCDGTGQTQCDPINICPSGTVMLADSTDPECRRFHLCANGILTRNVGECPFGTVFNRNFGTCTTPASAPCLGFMDSPCQPGAHGFFRVWGSCTAHAFCQFGTEVSRHECPDNYHFNPDTRSCDDPRNLATPCPWQ